MTEALKSFRASAQSSVLILLDLSAAFDIVNHRIHLSILSSMGISGRAHSWFESYLTGRSFNVSWQAVCTSPQGCPKAWCCHLHHLVGPNHLFAWFFISLLCIWYPTVSVFPSWRHHCLGMDHGLSLWYIYMDHHLRLNLAKMKLLVFPAKQAIHRNIDIQIDSLSYFPSKAAINLGVN